MTKTRVLTVTLNPSIDKTIALSSLEVGGLNRTEEIRLDPGGKGINVARILRTFGVPVTAGGFIAGSLGEQIRASLEKEGIRTDFIEVAGETRTNLKLVDLSRQLTTEVNEPGFTVAAPDIERLLAKITGLVEDAKVVVLGGSLPKGVPVSFYADLIQAARNAGAKTILDADGEAFAAGLKAIPYAVKPNLFELEQLTGRELKSDRDILAAGKELLERGVSLAVISMGAQGAVVMDEREAYRVRPFPVTPLSTVGAGDSMVAVMAHSLLAGEPLERLARWSTAAGTLTAAKAGTQVCTFAEIRQHAHKVIVDTF